MSGKGSASVTNCVCIGDWREERKGRINTEIEHDFCYDHNQIYVLCLFQCRFWIWEKTSSNI